MNISSLFKIKIFLALVLLTVGVLSESAMASSKKGASEFVISLGDDIIETIRNDKLSSQQKEITFEKMFVRYVDVAWIARFVLGRSWRTLSSKQKKDFYGVYKDFLVGAYVPKFKEYSGENLVVTNALLDREDEYIVETELTNKQHNVKYSIAYRVRFKDGEYKIFDMIAEGVSLIATHRTDFDTAISQSGFDALLSRLKEKVG